jgi:tyrosyl-tRNA synthetase
MKNLFRGIIDVFPEISENFLSSPKRVKLGFDPTTDTLHLGHSVLLRKMSQFQKCGHKPIIIIGDFTARIGDPTGKSKTRVQLSKEQVDENVNNFVKTISKFLNLEDCELVFNSSHLEKLSLVDIISLQSAFTVNQLLHKEDFRKRFESETPIGLHELMYPILQGFDSFVVNSDIELGGTDQKFNVSAGRIIQSHMNSGNKQIGILMPILVGTDGKQKMSKSLNNFIGLDEHPLNMFSKLEKIPDESVDNFIELLTDIDLKTMSTEPRERQKQMAFSVVASFHGENVANEALKSSEAIVFSNETPKEAETLSISNIQFPILFANLLKELELTKTNSEGRRLISNGSIKINGEKVTNESHQISSPEDIDNAFVQLTRTKFFRLVANQ